MAQSAFFTILTASLNCGSTIRSTLESIRSQTFSSAQHIVIDGGSTDATLDIIKEFNGTYDLSWISGPDGGIAEALNKGLARAHGRYILVIQADDRLVSEDILQQVYALMNDEGRDIWSFPVFMDHPERGRVLLKPVTVLWWHHFKNIFRHQGSFVHRRLYDRIGGYRQRFSIAMDYDFFYRALMTAPRLQFGGLPVSIMGGTGLGTSTAFLSRRLSEEFAVQKLNETNPCWRLAQVLFHMLYRPYKTRAMPARLPARDPPA